MRTSFVILFILIFIAVLTFLFPAFFAGQLVTFLRVLDAYKIELAIEWAKAWVIIQTILNSI